jgi:RimJ/RimL family protein N-acetyltransferase
MTRVVPRLETERLILREWRNDDVDWYVAVSADERVRKYIGGVQNRTDAWRTFAGIVGHWYMRGHGFWVVERKTDGARVGALGALRHETWPGLEIGWQLNPEFWGAGYASEGARAAQDWAFANLPDDTLISCIDPENTASQKVAQRLGNTKGKNIAMKVAGEDFTVDVWEKTRAQWKAEKRTPPKVIGEHKLPPMPRVETERLILREWRPEDVAVAITWSQNEEIARHTVGQPQSPIDAWRGLIAIVGHWFLRGYGYWAVERKEDRALIGRVGLWHPEGWPGMEVGYTLGRDYWGKGYATEAACAAMDYGFRNFDIPKLLSVIHVGNEHSQAVARRLGERPGPRSTIKFGMTEFEVDSWEITRNEWEEGRR